ncbi:CGNR zinc finger domain-containing protein [Flindersiella endophytica]
MTDTQEIPEYARLLRDFTNTVDEPNSIEALPNGHDLAQWLRHYGLLTEPGSVPPAEAVEAAVEAATPAELALALRLRSGLRTAMEHHHDGISAPVPELDAACRELPLRVAFDGVAPGLEPAESGVLGGLGRLAAAIITAQSEGGWRRLKLCHAEDCRYSFYDGSKNRSKHWCSMSACGNRQKTRTYRTRSRERTASSS